MDGHRPRACLRAATVGQIGFRPVPGPPTASRLRLPRARLLLPAVAAAGALALAGCGEEPDTDRGRDLFIANCGTCHTLAQAGTSANIGPNLDAVFAQARADGMD